MRWSSALQLLLRVMAVVFCGLVVALISWPAFTQSTATPSSLLSFCLAGKPASDPTTQAAFEAQCPAYLQSQFAGAAAVNAASAVAVQQAQEANQASLYQSLEGLLKAPPPQVASGVNLSNLAVVATVKDAEQTFEAASAVGAQLQPYIDAAHKALLVPTSSALAMMLAMPVNAATVSATLNDYATPLQNLKCEARAAQVLGLDDALLLATVVTVGGTLASAFQPTLVATGTTAGVADASMLIAAGLKAGLGPQGSLGLIVHPPAINAKNTVLVALGKFQAGLAHATTAMSNCTVDPQLAAKKQLLANANAYFSNITQVIGTSPSALDAAAQKAALSDSQIANTLLVQRDVSGGGISAVKPNWVSSTKLIMTTADVLTYQLTGIDDGVIIASNFVEPKQQWAIVCALDQWQNAYNGCSTTTSGTSAGTDQGHH